MSWFSEVVMLRNYLTVAIRNLLRHKVYSLINVAGLAIALMCCILVFLFVEDELSYDRYHENADRIYKVVRQDAALTPGPLAAALLSDFPEVVRAARIASGFGKMLVSYGERSFYEKQFLFADASVFDIFTFPFIKGDPGTALREPNTIVVTRDMARKYFGGEDPLGKTLRVSEMGNWYDYEVKTVHEGSKVRQIVIRYIGKSGLRPSRSMRSGGVMTAVAPSPQDGHLRGKSCCWALTCRNPLRGAAIQTLMQARTQQAMQRIKALV